VLLKALPAAVGVDDVDPDRLAVRQCCHHSAQCACSAALAADHPSEVVLMNAHFEGVPAAVVLRTDLDILRTVNDPADKVFESF
jgi:hypothetical protein